MPTSKRSSHVVLTSHPGQLRKQVVPISWGAKTPAERGPIIATLTNVDHRNAIGTHSGSYTIYRALATAAGALTMDHIPDLTNTSPVEKIGPFPSWYEPGPHGQKIVSIDPWGHVVADAFKGYFAKGYDIRPSI